jgi:hypothetical protein
MGKKEKREREMNRKQTVKGEGGFLAFKIASSFITWKRRGCKNGRKCRKADHMREVE